MDVLEIGSNCARPDAQHSKRARLSTALSVAQQEYFRACHHVHRGAFRAVFRPHREDAR